MQSLYEHLEELEKQLREEFEEKRRQKYQKRKEQSKKKPQDLKPQKSEFQFFSELMQAPPAASKSTWNDDYNGGEYAPDDSFSWDYYFNDDWNGDL